MNAPIPIRMPDTLAAKVARCWRHQQLVREAGMLCTADAPDDIWDKHDRLSDDLERLQADLRAEVLRQTGVEADHLVEALS